jgi:hypothetical protein
MKSHVGVALSVSLAQSQRPIGEMVQRMVTLKKVAMLDQVLNKKFPGADRTSLELTIDAEISVVSKDEAGVETSSAPVRWSTEPITLTDDICFGQMLVRGFGG